MSAIKASELQCVFLDRDGVINRERADYVKSWDEFEILPGVLTALQRLAQLPGKIILVTNQSAIGRGVVSRHTVDALHRQLCQLIAQAGGRIDAIYLCPHHPESACQCRKPKPGLLLQAAVDHQLTLTQTLFIGDSLTDYQAAQAVGSHSILVKSGRQGDRLAELLAAATTTTSTTTQNKPLIVANLEAAVSLLF